MFEMSRRERNATAALLLLLAVAGAALAYRVASARAARTAFVLDLSEAPEQERPHEEPHGTPDPPPGSTGSNVETEIEEAGSPDARPPEMYVHVAGAVKSPGVYRLKPGDRVIDAVAAAGGATAEAAPDALNLAAPVSDGERVYVPTRREAAQAGPAHQPTYGSGSATSPSTGTSRPRVVNLNRATAADLETLPGIGPSLAQRILDYRRDHGPFRTVEELQNVSGIGPKKFEELRPYVTVQ